MAGRSGQGRQSRGRVISCAVEKESRLSVRPSSEGAQRTRQRSGGKGSSRSLTRPHRPALPHIQTHAPQTRDQHHPPPSAHSGGEGSSRSLTRPHRPALPHIHTFTHSHIHTFTHSHIHTLTHSHIHTLTHSHTRAPSCWISIIPRRKTCFQRIVGYETQLKYHRALSKTNLRKGARDAT
jgi:hypothetical protein